MFNAIHSLLTTCLLISIFQHEPILAIRIHLESRVMKCYSEDFPKQTKVHLYFDFEGYEDEDKDNIKDMFQGIVSVHSPRGEELVYDKGTLTDTKMFVTTAAGYYRFCFASVGPEGGYGEFVCDLFG